MENVPFNIMKIKQKRLKSAQVILTGFALLILLGALLLMLPVSSKTHRPTDFLTALFTSTSASCVTALIVVDTGSYWSAFGQTVILILIQIGGLGVVTVAILLSLMTGRRIGLSQRSIMQDSISAPQVGGIVKLTRFILIRAFIIEGAGALLLMPVFIRDFGPVGIWYGLFHSISAFCNAGFDLLGSQGMPYASIACYRTDPYFMTVIMLLIIIGGLGFIVWRDISLYKFKLSRYRLQSRMVLVTTVLLIVVPALLFFFCEYSNEPMRERILDSLFQSVTARTAGFAGPDPAKMSRSGQLLQIMLQLIGGSPGSTAGGIKTTTFAVLILSMIAVFQRRPYAVTGKRRIGNEVIKNAAAIMLMYLLLFSSAAMIISRIESISLADCLYETASAIGTVGLTLGITKNLGPVSRLILILLMYIGRMGGLTTIYAAVRPRIGQGTLPEEPLTVG